MIAAESLPAVLTRHEILHEEWLGLRVRDGIQAAGANPAFHATICAAWPRPFDMQRIRETRATLPRDGRGVPCKCGGTGVVPLWAQCAFDTGFRVDLYLSAGGRSAVSCEGCTLVTSPFDNHPGVPAGAPCSICDSLGVVPTWVTNLLFGSPTIEWQLRNGGTWFPAPCIACGGWGRAARAKGEPEVHTPPTMSKLETGHELFRDGAVWHVTYGGVTRTFEHRLGFQYLAHLLAAPDRRFHVRELAACVRGHEPPGAHESDLIDAGLRVGRELAGQNLIDVKALKDFRRRLAAIDQELETAHANNDAGTIERLELERLEVLAAVNAATKPGGALAKLSDDTERARKAVTNAIASAIKHLATGHPALASQLKQRVATGNHCIYSPSDGAIWDVRM
jgi:hypothetical protein